MPHYKSQVRFDRICLECFDEIATPTLLFSLSPGDFLRKWSGGAQTTTSGGVTGVVTDQSLAVLPNADVEIRDINKGTTDQPKQTAMACTASSFFLPANTR